MPADKRPSTGESDGLGTNWKSAQCVTSLYDSYIQVQQENEQLREDVRRLQQNESLLTPYKLQQPEETRNEELEQEIQLLRSEKLRMEETHRLELQKFEARAADSEALHQQLVVKYQEKFEFDPLETKRAALAVKTIQNTLQNVILEKEELGVRYGELKDQYRKFHNEQMDIVDKLRHQVTMLEQQQIKNGQQRVINALTVWSANKMATAWNKWRTLTKDERQQEEKTLLKSTFDRKIDDRIEKMKAQQGALLAIKFMQQAAKRNFDRWREWTWQKLERRRKGERIKATLSRLQLKCLMATWRRKSRKQKRYQAGVYKIERLVALSSRRWGMRKWSTQTFRLALIDHKQRLLALNDKIEFQNDRIIELELFLNDARNDSQEVQRLQDQDKREFMEELEKQQAASLAVQHKFVQFISKQSERQVLKNVVREWKTIVIYTSAVRQRTNIVQLNLRELKLQKALSWWHCKALECHKSRLRMQCVLKRLRQLGVLRCFNSWKERVNEVKAKKTALLYAVNRIRKREVSQCFVQWVFYKNQQMAFRNGLEMMTSIKKKHHTSVAFGLWKERIEEQRIDDQVQQQQQIQRAWEIRLKHTKRDLLCQQQHFNMWRQSVLSRQKRDIVVTKCLARLKCALLAKVFDKWGEYITFRKMQRELVRRWVGQCYTNILQRAWNQWQRQIVLKEQQLLMHRLREERDVELHQLETKFKEYRETQQTLLLVAQQVKAEQETKLQTTAKSLQEEARQAKRFAVVVEHLCAKKHRGLTQSRVLKAWHYAVRRSNFNRDTIDSFQSRLDVRLMRSVLHEWNQFNIQQHRLKAVFTLIHSCCSQRWQIQCFEAWKEARRLSKTVQRFTMLYLYKSNEFVARRTIQEWRKVTKKNFLLRKIIEHIYVTKVRQQFTRWMQFTRCEAVNERVEKQKVAVRALQAKLLWRHTLSTVRCCVVDWKRIVKSKKKQQAGERKLILFQHTRLVAVCFNNWTELVAIQKKERDRNSQLARWLRRDRHRRQQRAISLWKLLLIRNQRCELQRLIEVRATQQEEVELQLKKVAVLTKSKNKLTHIPTVHDISTATMQYLSQCGLMAKCFNAFKLRVSMTRHQHRTVCLSQKNARRQRLTKVLFKWISFLRYCREVKSIVARNLKQHYDPLLRKIIRRWQSIACQQLVMKQKQLKLQQKGQARMLKNALERWCRSIHTEKGFRSAANRVENILERLILKNTFILWRKKGREETNRVNQERLRHKRMVQLLRNKQEAILVRLFQRWKEYVQTKHAARLLAQQRLCIKSRAFVTKCWHGWCFFVQTSGLKRRCVVGMETLIMRYYYRVALSRWKRYLFFGQIETLQTSNEFLSCQIAEANLQLQSKSLSVDRLSTEVRDLQHKVVESESNSSAQLLEVKDQEGKRSQQLHCLQALNKLLLKRTVSRDLSVAFNRWTSALFHDRRKQCVLASVASTCQRKKRTLAFWMWKIKTLRWRRLDLLQKRWRTRELLLLLQRWQHFSTIRAKQRLFLTKRCLLSYTTRALPISIAFRLWKVKSAALSHHATLFTQLKVEQAVSRTNLRRLALGKWCWTAYYHRLSQMRAFLSRCHVELATFNTGEHRRIIGEMQQYSDAALAEMKQKNEAKIQEELGVVSFAEEQAASGASYQAIQTLIRRLFQSNTVQELFVSVSSTFAQVLHGTSAVLFLFDPQSNELWTQREEMQLIQVPASLGIAGSTLSSGSSLIVMDVSADSRYHPMVDQFVLSSLQSDNSWKMTACGPSIQSSKPTYGIVSSALVSSDGAVYGVLQVAFSMSSLSLLDRRLLVTQTQLYSKICCFYVEQIVFEMLRNCRDRVRARVPDKFIRLFKQNKNWRKYYAGLERKALEMEGKLRDTLAEHEQLLQSKLELEQSHELVKDRLEEKDHMAKDMSKLVSEWKKKLVKWQQLSEEKDRTIMDKTSELERVEKSFEDYRRKRRIKDVQKVLHASALSHGEECGDDKSAGKSQIFSDSGQLSILRADTARLKSQLVRAEADNLLLVKALTIARNHHGELSKTIQTEVTRVATRVESRVTET